MGQVGFGQPDDGVIQMAYVVEDIHRAMDHWVKKLKVGPWFVLDHFSVWIQCTEDNPHAWMSPWR